MKILHNINLKQKNTFHIGGIAVNYYIPESEKDLNKIIKKTENQKIYVLSGGSNILINDKKKFEHVVYMGEIDKSFNILKADDFYIGASLRIQEVINKLNSLGYGGIEEMYSLPAMFGGIIYMNAGIGKKSNPLFTISDFINSVKVYNLRNSKIEWIEKEKCDFSHRFSIFQNNNYLILGAICNFKKQEIDKSKERISTRIKKVQNQYEMGRGTFGTCFSEANPKLLKIISIINKKSGGVHFASNNSNWLVNDGSGTFNDCMALIMKCELLHKICHKKIKREVRIWE